MSRVLRLWLALPVIAAWLAVGPAAAAPAANDAIQAVWERSDRPVAELRVSRTWMWGPAALSGPLEETYVDAEGAKRLVQYFDKSRMEINNPKADATSPWYVTNGLLAKELITGDRQLGDSLTEHFPPAEVNVAGDANDPNGPTYATFNSLMGAAPLPVGATVVQTVDRAGAVQVDDALSSYGVSASLLIPETNHTIASVFWDFMNLSGLVFQSDQFVQDRLSENPFYIAGYPLTEPYWTRVQVQGVSTRVLVQVFERRVLTYTPANSDGWKVEAGNVGQHYFAWRYAQSNTPPVPAPPQDPPIEQPGPSAPSAAGDLRITGIMADPPGSQATGEYVDIRNFDTVAIQMQGWTLNNAQSDTYTFPNVVLPAGASVRLHMCSGTNSAAHLYWGRCRETWDNNGDTGYLYNPSGVLASSYVYTPEPSTPQPPATSEESCLNATEQAVLTLINNYRAQNGVAPLSVSASLNVASYRHSLDMGTRRYFDHNTRPPLPPGQSGPLPWDRMSDAGYNYNTNKGENIAAGYATAQAVFDGWRNSSGHNAAMLNPNYGAIGIGLAVVAGSPNTYYWTTDFGGVVDAAPGCA